MPRKWQPQINQIKFKWICKVVSTQNWSCHCNASNICISCTRFPNVFYFNFKFFDFYEINWHKNQQSMNQNCLNIYKVEEWIRFVEAIWIAESQNSTNHCTSKQDVVSKLQKWIIFLKKCTQNQSCNRCPSHNCTHLERNVPPPIEVSCISTIVNMH